MGACHAPFLKPRPRRRALRIALGTITAATVLGSLFASPLVAQTVEPDESVSALVRALERRMTVWRSPTGETVQYVGHCRAARGGCTRRVTTFATLIGEASGRHELDPFLLAAVAVRESGLNPLAAGAAGERGIVQLHPRGSGSRVRFVRSEAYRQRCSRTDGACQEEILDVGARLLARSIERCGSVREGLGAYNRGECGSTSYTDRVMRERAILLRLAKRTSTET